MTKETKTELAVIDFTKFSVAQLPELKGKKEEIASIIKANPIVEIVDNATYESAKKSRTAVKTLRTGLEKEQKDVKKKIKEHVLDVVDKEYDTLVLGVKSAEQSRQEPIDVWEEKKEQERQEKARLEEQRIDGIKKRIGAFRQNWEDLISQLLYDGIHDCENNFKNMVDDFDRVSLQEFEVLFDDAISYLTNLLNSRISTLTEQEQIRIGNLVIEEKNSENRKIQSWQNTWNTNISSLVFDDITDVKKSFRQSKLEFLKHYATEYDEIYNSTEKRLHSQIEFVSKAEEQRIAKEKFDKEQAEIAENNRIVQEKFLKEKQEFEAKQLEAKFQERKKFLVDEDYWRIYFIGECNEEESVAKDKLLAYSEEEFENFKLSVLKAKEPKEVSYVGMSKEAIKGILSEQDALEKFEIEFQEEPISRGAYVGPKLNSDQELMETSSEISDSKVVFEDVSQKSVEPIAEFDLPKEVTWNEIYNEWNLVSDKFPDAFEFLKQFYNVPTKKQ